MSSPLKVFYSDPGEVGYSIRRRRRYLMELAPSGIALVSEVAQADLQVLSCSETLDQIANPRFVLYLHNSSTNFKQFPVEIVQAMERALLCCSWCDYPAQFKGNYRFRRLPQGVDPAIFFNRGLRRDFDALTTGWMATTVFDSDGWHGEPIMEVHAAADRAVHAGGHPFEGLTREPVNGDEDIAMLYNRSRYVSGLRWRDGFECPVLEGLLCGCRPIVFDLPNFRHWWADHALFVPHKLDGLVSRIATIVAEDPIPVSYEERDFLVRKFSWQTLASDFWSAVLDVA